MDDVKFLKLAIEKSKQSAQEGNFPAGALVVKNTEIISSAVSSPFPNLLHSDSKAIINAFEKIGSLHECTLYIGLESCLMCSSIAFWSGLRRIVFAISMSKISHEYYVTDKDEELISLFHTKIESVYIPKFENEALKIVRDWEAKNK